ncbi:efflux transporter periplasmic adaptor subunit [Virgibacillus profundi]|uniref:Efflux transporter periplasmic adaptor subunit n=1 Tax=Virgibacillus profundi TaxID=2024555 RepID=A0A2A2IJP6_9BACI|nr:efflux RND transporter periplasmic adaptor subunit [Virgibacillus profundi]PAV31325.1 efflux transporter periplasmic adaptor subunit [Virgibacillus profundi]PXY55510.1 efflux RND transporter periplasmic adaptor subunit [Virgibacillus profundi]
MNKKTISMILILLIALLAACNQDEDTNKDEEERVVPVETAEVTEGDLVIEKSVYGRTAPSATAPIMLETPGEIDTLEVENGDQVEEDDLIATLSTPAGTQNVRAPRDGEVVNLTGAAGDMVSNEEPFALIADMHSVKLEFSVTAKVRELFEKEATLDVTARDKEYEAEITAIGSMPNDTGLYEIEAEAPNEDGEILPGTVIEMTVPEKRIEKAIIVPTASVFEENDESFVYVVKDNKAMKQKVTIQETQSDKTAIEGDVKAGDQVVVTGQLTLTDESRVDVQEGE